MQLLKKINIGLQKKKHKVAVERKRIMKYCHNKLERKNKTKEGKNTNKKNKNRKTKNRRINIEEKNLSKKNVAIS